MVRIFKKKVEENKEDKLITDVLEAIESLNSSDKVSCLLFSIYRILISISKEEREKINLPTQIYTMLSGIATPLEIANIIGTIGLLLIAQHPEVAEVMNKIENLTKPADKTGFII